MDQSLELTKMKNELTDLTSSDRLKISSDRSLNSVKQESDCLVQSEIHIKTEPQEDEDEFPVIASTSYNICQSYDMKFEMVEPLVKIECGGHVDELVQNPLDVDDKIKAEEHFSIHLDHGELGIKIAPIEAENDENILKTDDDFDSQGSGSNQNQLLIRNDSDRRDQKYVCNECNKIFTKKYKLNIHLRVHTGAKPYLCEICKKSFNLKHHLAHHMLIHSDTKPHSCDVCKKCFRHKSHLNDHKLIHSGMKPFSCDVCKKSFIQKQDLVKHKRIHTGEKPFSCSICNKAFVSTSPLIVHKRTHTGEKPFSCNICKKMFTQKINLDRHKKIHMK